MRKFEFSSQPKHTRLKFVPDIDPVGVLGIFYFCYSNDSSNVSLYDLCSPGNSTCIKYQKDQNLG